jgi:peptidoglycan/LPS O-acetylase OafA/YrhL
MTARTQSHSIIPSLDGFRAIAVALVFFAHGGLEHVIPGGLGVTIFFVLSGFLISTLMRIEYAATQRIDYRGFYLRRLLRLMPPLIIIVGIVSILSMLAVVTPFSSGGLFSVLFYYGNYFVIAHHFQGIPDGLGVVWSLAVEEHYYLLYPPLAAVLLRIGRVGLSFATLAALCLAVLAWRCWLALNGVGAEYISMATDTRIDAILIGCLMALWRNPWLDVPRLDAARAIASSSSSRRDVPLIVLSLATLLFTLLYRDEFFRMTFRYALQSVAVAVLLYFAVARARHWSFRWLNSRPLVYVGTISYTVYLSHHVIIQTLANHWPQLSWLPKTLLAIALTWAVAEPMRRWVEQPCARLRQRLHKRRDTGSTSMPIIHPAASGGTQ